MDKFIDVLVSDQGLQLLFSLICFVIGWALYDGLRFSYRKLKRYFKSIKKVKKIVDKTGIL